MKALQQENARPKKLVTYQALERGDSAGAGQEKLVSPERRRQMVAEVFVGR
jgi:hypothetical protein